MIKTVNTRVAIAAMVCSLFCGGCADIDKQKVGAGAGAVIGGVIGNQANTKNKRTAVVLGALIGGAVGSQLGKYLDDKDKTEIAAAQQRAFETGRSQTWRNSATGNSGRVNVTSQDPRASKNLTKVKPASSSTVRPLPTTPTTSDSGRATTADTSGRVAAANEPNAASNTPEQKTCKTIRQSITLKDGSTHEEDITACKGPNGWETV